MREGEPSVEEAPLEFLVELVENLYFNAVLSRTERDMLVGQANRAAAQVEDLTRYKLSASEEYEHVAQAEQHIQRLEEALRDVTASALREIAVLKEALEALEKIERMTALRRGHSQNIYRVVRAALAPEPTTTQDSEEAQ